MASQGEWTAASLFAGIGGFEIGLSRAGVRTVASVEIDDKARGVLAHRFPEVTLFPDVQEVTADDILRAGFNPERGILTAGFPCQDVSLAGKRAGLAGARTGLFWEIIRIARELQPRWFLLENVPGLLTSNGGRDMGTVLGALVELGYGVGWRVLDAQHFGVPQRRRRVFLAGCLGDPAGAGEVLLEPESCAGDLAASGAAGSPAPGAVADGAVRRGGPGLLAERGIVQGLTSSLGTGGPDAQHAQAGWLIPEKVVPDREIAGTLTTRYYKGVNSTVDDGALAVSFRKSKRARDDQDDESWVQEDHSNTLNCFDVGETRSTQLVTFALQPHQGGPGDNVTAVTTEISPSLTSSQLARGSDRGLRVVSPTGEISHTLTAHGFDASEDGTGRGWPTVAVEGTWGVRRLTPVECERLQGFPSYYTWSEDMTRDEFAASLLAAGAVTVDTEEGRAFKTRGPGGVALAEPSPVPGSDCNGYLVASFRLGGLRKQLRLHRLVWIAAHGIPAEGMAVCHRDNNKKNNRLDNLYLATPEQNSADAARDGLYPTGDAHAKSKVTEAQRTEMAAARRDGATIHELMERYGLSRERTYEIVRESGHTAERRDLKKDGVVAQSDSARGHQIGNAVATPVITWIGRRMVAVGEELLAS